MIFTTHSRENKKIPEKRDNTEYRVKKEAAKTNKSPVDHILHLQRNDGNQAVLRLVSSGFIQAKLKISQPNDTLEREADKFAGMIQELENSSQTTSYGSEISRNSVNMKEASGDAADISADIEAHIRALSKSSGQTLPNPIRSFFERTFGYDFGHLRIHNDPKANELAKILRARAFTLGHDIVFGAGQYAPETNSGKSLLAHELTHLIQQEQDRLSKISAVVAPEIGLTISQNPSRSSIAVQREPQESSEATELERKGLPGRVLKYLDKATLFPGKQSLKATVRVKGIEINFPDGGKLYVDRSETPLDYALIKQKLEAVEAQMKWYIRILPGGTASKGKITDLAENELASRLFIINRITEGKNLKDILSELHSLDIANFNFVATSASTVLFIAGMAVGTVKGPKAGPLKNLRAPKAASSIEQAAVNELARAKARGGPVAVNIGGKGEIEGAINLNPNISSVEKAPNWPNWVAGRGEELSNLFPPKSIDNIYGVKLPTGLDWDMIASGAQTTLKPGGKVSITVLGSAEVIATALRRAGFKDVRVISEVIVEAIK